MIGDFGFSEEDLHSRFWNADIGAYNPLHRTILESLEEMILTLMHHCEEDAYSTLNLY